MKEDSDVEMTTVKTAQEEERALRRSLGAKEAKFSTAKKQRDWQNHPSEERKNQGPEGV